MRVLLTGISGFLGGHMTRQLTADGHRVAGVVIPGHEGPDDAELHEADLTDRSATRRVVESVDPDAVIHLAALSHVGRSWSAMADYYRVNVEGTEHLLEAAAGRRILFASSAEVYGMVPEEEQPISEQRQPAPQSPYAYTKAFGERMAARTAAIVVRSFNVVGPGQARLFALPSFASQLAAIVEGAAEPVLRVGNLEARRDFLHVADAVRAWSLLLDRGEPGTSYNLGSGEAVSIRQALEMLIEVSGASPRIEVDPARYRPVDLPLLVADASRLRALGWHAERSLRSALEEVWCEARNGGGTTTPSPGSA